MIKEVGSVPKCHNDFIEYLLCAFHIHYFLFFKALIELTLPLFIDEETKAEFNLICSRPYLGVKSHI